MITFLEYLQQRSGGQTYPVAVCNPESFDEDAQDYQLSDGDIDRKSIAESHGRARDAVTSVLDGIPTALSRQQTPFRFFLDGCRRAYYICDMATPDGRMLPIVAGQYSTAIVERSRESGRVSLHDYSAEVVLMFPSGGYGLNREDIKEIERVVSATFARTGMRVESVDIRNQEDPKQNLLAYLNKLMQHLEVRHLERMTSDNRLGQSSIVIVDGALQFQNIKEDRRYLLRYAVGISKRFKLHLRGVTGRSVQVGTHVLQLKRVGDRTTAFRTKEKDRRAYAFWYLRIQPIEKMAYPYAGVVKIEKMLVEEEELAYGLSGDIIDNLSRYVLLERSVTPYGLDHRWASHIYPVYLTEQVQKQKFLSDHFFSSILARKVTEP